MGWREDVKFGIARISELYLGDENGSLGTDVTDNLLTIGGLSDVSVLEDLADNLSSTAAEIDAVVSGGAGPSIPILTSEKLSGSAREFEFTTKIQIGAMLPPGICTATVTAYDYISLIWATAAEQALGDFSYALFPFGMGPGGFSTDPTAGDALLEVGIPTGPLLLEVWVQGPSGNSFRQDVQLVLLDNEVSTCEP